MKTEKIKFNDWMDHIANQLQADYRKLYYSSKLKSKKNIKNTLHTKNKALVLK
jgi:hypothetical protein